MFKREEKIILCGRTLVLAIALVAFGGISLAKDKNPAPKAPTPKQSETAGEIMCDKMKSACTNEKAVRDMLRKKKSPKEISQPTRESTTQR